MNTSKSGKNRFFTEQLIKWNIKYNKRIMPWKGIKDTYKIWVSEIILQQTRVEQGRRYYENFIENFPDITSLADAEEEILYKVCEGLGYYSRIKNMHLTAKKILADMDGKFPDNYAGLLNLKGIGAYTASAISSFAYGLPHAVVDGNVLRVLARFFGEDLPVDSLQGKKYFNELANQLLYIKDPASYNQAIMDFGATICKPQIAECQHCLLKKNCSAFQTGRVNQLPVKEKIIKKRKRFFTYFIFTLPGKVLVTKRIAKDIWENLYEFYLNESASLHKWNDRSIDQWLNEQLGIVNYQIIQISGIYKQTLTHQHLEGRFITIELSDIPESLKQFELLNIEQLGVKAFPKFITQYLQSDLNILMS